ncbi:MAG TPA: glycosyltransferase family 39 protein [Pyrinomonadaceae bacterium]|nr:glycosyltransferase family 39 protein [Pyrinomonadaceae bacterium]
MQFSTLAKPLTLTLFVAIAVFYVYGLGHLPFVGPDEARYAQVAREMFERGDLITPTLGGHIWFEKPSLLYWLMIASYTVFGVSESSARLGPAICGVLSIVAVFWVGRRVSNKVQGLGVCSALMLASSLGFIVFSRAASFDIVVTMTLTWALAFFIACEIEEQDKRKRKLLAGFYVFIGLSLLAKGLIGFVIPLGIVTAYFLLRRRRPRKLVWTSLLWGLPLSALIAATWYGPMFVKHGALFFDEFIVQHHFARYLSNTYHHPAPVYYYVVILVLLSLPWAAFIVEALIRIRRWLWRTEDGLNRMRTFALVWILVPLVFFSFSNSKLPGYILPVLPALALLGGERLAEWLDSGTRGRWAMRATGLVCFALAISALVYSIGRGDIPISLIIAAPSIIAGTLALLPMPGRTTQMVSIAIAIAALALGALHVAAPNHAAQDTAKFLLQQADERGYGRTVIYGLQPDDRTPEFYAAGRVTYAEDGEPVMYVGLEQIGNEITRQGGPVLVFVPDIDAELFSSQRAVRTVVIGSNGRHALIVVGPLGEWR